MLHFKSREAREAPYYDGSPSQKNPTAVKLTHSHDREVIYCGYIISSEGLFTHFSFYCQSMSDVGRLTIGAGCTDTVTFIPDFAAASLSTISLTRTDFHLCTIPATAGPLPCLLGAAPTRCTASGNHRLTNPAMLGQP